MKRPFVLTASWMMTVCLVCLICLVATPLAAQGQDAGKDQQEAGQTKRQQKPKVEEIEIPKDWVRLSRKREIWADMKNKRVIVSGQICLEKGLLELFACSMETKTHESIIAINARASEVHAGLLAIGAKPGNPVTFDPKFKPAKGPKVEVMIHWKKDGKLNKRRAQEMILNSKTGKPLDMDFVFGGSMIWVDPDTGEKIYYGDSGDFICVSNFTSATLDLPVQSSASNDLLAYETNTKKIPPLGTKVYLYLKPEIEKKKAADDKTKKKKTGQTDKSDKRSDK